LTRGWILGPTEDIPSRMLPVMRLVSPVRFFDSEMLVLARAVSERYITPLATVLGALAPPRVAGEERAPSVLKVPAADLEIPDAGGAFEGYVRGAEFVAAIGRPTGPRRWAIRPAPEDEAALAVTMVGAALRADRSALVLVPEAEPVPATARAVADAFADRVAMFLGGSQRVRYRTWLRIARGEADVVVGTRAAVFAPVRSPLGVIVVDRESHAAFRDDRAPYYHAREVALARARLERAAPVCALMASCPSAETVALGLPEVHPSTRRWPKVEVVRPGAEGRAPRLVAAIREVRRAFIYAPNRGYGIAQICKACGAPAACASCGGMLRSEQRVVRCIVCEASGRCAACGASDFGIRRGGAERVEEWVGRLATVPVSRPQRPRLPETEGEILVGGPDLVRDLGAGGLDLVAILDADQAAARPGLGARERALATWMEAAGWASPNGRVIVQSAHPSDPAVQALVRGNADRFHARERERRAAAGFPVGSAVFRIIGNDELEAVIGSYAPISLLATALGRRTVCLLALDPERLPSFGATMRTLAATGVVERVEAEPHI
jgi:primosomal protein N' (replication factor Y) (superfamily II helicase)